MGKDADKIIDETDVAKRAHYAYKYKDSGVLFSTFGMDAEGRLGPQAADTIRHFANRPLGEQFKRGIFRRYWTRRNFVGVLAQQMKLLQNRQK